MPAKAVIAGIVLVFMAMITVYAVEFFLPLSMKADMDLICRGVLLQMENAGGLSEDVRQQLAQDLEEKGIQNVQITAPYEVPQGSLVTLRVEGSYTYSRILSLFKRGEATIRMVFNKASMARKVIN